MARIRYQPATKTKGFQPIQLTKDGISRMREETNRVVGGMQQNLRAEQEQQKKNLQAMQDNAAYTERITKENRAIEVQNLKNEQLSITQTAERDAQQAQYDAAATQTILTSIQDFSQTAAKKAAANTAKQLEDQTDAAMAVDISSLRFEDGGKYEEAQGTFATGAALEDTAAVTEGAESGVGIDVTFDRLAGNAGLGAIGRRILANRVYGEAHRIFTDRAFGSDEKKYELNGKKFSGADSRNSREQTAVVQSYVTNEVTRYMRKSFGVTDGLYFTDGKTQAEEENELERNRSSARGVEFKRQVKLDQANVLISSDNTVNIGLGYHSVVSATSNYTTANTAVVNRIKSSNSADEAKRVGAFTIIGQNGKTTTWAERYPKLFEQAEQGRVDRINGRNRENKRVAKEQYQSLRDNNADYLEEEIKKSPHKTWKEIADADALNDVTSSKRLKRAYDSAIKGLADQESALLDSKILSRTLDSTFVNALEDSANSARGKEAFKQLQEQELGGELGVGLVSGFNETAKQQTKVNAPMGTQQTYLFEARMLNEYKAHFKKHGDALAANQYVQDLITAGNNDDKSSPFYKENRGTSMYYPNLETPDKDKAKRRQDINKAVLENGIGVVDMPEALATTQEMDASHLSFSKNNVGYYPAGILQTAELTGRTPSEVFNAHRKANNKKYGTNKPLITPSLISDVIDQSNPRVRKLLTSGNAMQVRQGAAEVTGRLNQPENMRSTFRNTPLQSFAPQVSSVTFDTGQPGIDVFFEDHNFPAVLPGMVKDIGYQVNANGSGYGHYLVIESIDPDTGEPVDVLYGHLPSKPTQSRGQSINLGEIIGKQGGTGSVQSYDGTIASIDFLAPAPPGSGSMTPYRNYDSLRRNIASQFQ